MTEHVHEWIPKVVFNKQGDGKVQAWCRECPDIMEWAEIKSRLNATESLDAEDALYAAGEGQSEPDENDEKVRAALRAYADILGGKDD